MPTKSKVSSKQAPVATVLCRRSAVGCEGRDERPCESSPSTPRPYHEVEVLRIEDFAKTATDRATLTHWLHNVGTKFSRPIEKRVRELLPRDIRKSFEGNTGRANDDARQLSFEGIFDVPFPPPETPKFTFIDLFAGIGGFRLAMQNLGGKCVFTSEWDVAAQKTYFANFGEVPYGDITLPETKAAIPDGFDILCAGFPCQPFSLAGVSKKNSLGRKHGFDDETQGTLFFDIKKILEQKSPPAFMLENVKNLLRHDEGRTFEVIRHTLEDVLGYVINWKIVDGAQWVPQHRERLFIVGYDPKVVSISKEDIFIPTRPNNGYRCPQLRDIVNERIEGYTLGPGTWATLERHKAHHARVGNGFGYGLHRLPIKKNEVTRTISARYHKDGAEILIEQQDERPRRLSVAEAMQLQGYDPQKFQFPISATQAYRQIGNSVVWPAIHSCATEIVATLQKKRK